jgi:hypothetical protein
VIHAAAAQAADRQADAIIRAQNACGIGQAEGGCPGPGLQKIPPVCFGFDRHLFPSSSHQFQQALERFPRALDLVAIRAQVMRFE